MKKGYISSRKNIFKATIFFAIGAKHMLKAMTKAEHIRKGVAICPIPFSIGPYQEDDLFFYS